MARESSQVTLENTYFLFRILGAILGIFLTLWKIILPLFDVFLKYRIDKIYTMQGVLKKQENHDTAINYMAEGIQNLERVCADVPSTVKILSEVRNIVDRLANDVNGMNVMLGRIDERTRKQ